MCSSDLDNLTVKLRQSNLVVLYADSKSTGAVDTFRSDLISYWFDNLGFILRENLLLHSAYLPLGVSQRTCVSRASRHFFGTVVGEVNHFCSANLDTRHQHFSRVGKIKPSARGVSHFQSLYFAIVLLSLFLLVLFASSIKTQKN